MDPSAPLDLRLLPQTAEVTAEGHLRVGGVDVVEAAAELGTPVFLYDEAHLKARCREAAEAFDDGVAYATKAFLCTAMARLALEQGLCLDVATGGELAVALHAEAPADRIIVHGNNKSAAELGQAIDLGVRRIIVDSFDEIERLGALVANRTQQVVLRLTPGVEAHTHEFIQTGQEDSKFGFSIASGAALRAVDAVRSTPGLELAGVHAHIGSQIFDVASFAKAAEILATFFMPLDLPELCVGGGLGVAYVNGEVAPSITEWATATKDALRVAGIGDAVAITAEPGRSIAAQAGLTVYSVGTIKDLPGIRRYVSVDGGMSDNPRPVLYGSGYEAFDPARVGEARPERARIVGKHCESGDVLIAEAAVPEGIKPGDLLATPVTGAYGYSMASNYNKVPRPAVAFLSEGAIRTVVRRETYEDLLRLDL